MKQVVLDLETYFDYFCAGFKDLATGHKRYFEMFDGQPFDIEKVRKVLRSYQVITFNGRNFDGPLLMLALQGEGPAKIKEVANAIIVGGLKGWQAEDKFNCKVPASIDSIDIFDVAPGKVSLKIYGGRMHSRKMQDLPIEPDALVTPEQRPLLREYCGNDLDTTHELFNTLSAQIALREQMSAEYGMDLRSKSDAQIAEAVIKSQLEKIKGERIYKPERNLGQTFRYVAPEFIQFRSQQLRDTLALVEGLEFTVTDAGKTLTPNGLKNHTVKIGTGVYKMGIGGLHSQEERVAHKVGGKISTIKDVDCTAFYPNIIMRCGLYPAHLGPDFLRVYKSVASKRQAAKLRIGQIKAEIKLLKQKPDVDALEKELSKCVSDSESLKVTSNGAFGKLSNVYSILYSPRLLVQVTLTGQLVLLMLIEMLEDAGISVASANTDGVTLLLKADQADLAKSIIWAWEFSTEFATEDVDYSSVHYANVNNYIAIKTDGSAKFKGVYAPSGVGPPTAGPTGKNPTNDICTEAVTAFLKRGTPVEETILACKDPRKFVSVRKVAGGAVYGDEYLGRAVRWYYSIASTGPLVGKVNGYKVPETDGARPMMELPETVPGDVDYDWYFAEAHKILKEIGATA